MSTSKHEISVEKAAEMTRKYRENRPDNFAICESFESDVILDLLSEPGCRYLRIYYGMDENNEVHAILVGANEKNEDILPPDSANTDAVTTEGGEGGGGVLDDGYRCPTYCPPPSKLNS